MWMSNTSFVKHKLTNWSQLEEYSKEMGHESFFKYINKVYYRLCLMKRGESFSITKNVRPANRDLFIKCACQFITDSAGIVNSSKYNTHSYYFTEDYKNIERR